MNQVEALNLLLSNRTLFKETLMSIEDKSRNLVPYRLNPIQADMNLTATGRDIYVKPAQVGFTSDVICNYLIDCLTIPGTTAVIISYDEFITGRLLRKAHAFYDSLKRKIPSIDKLKHASTNEMTFERLKSSFYISSSRSFTGVRGEVIHKLLLDEFAFWLPGEPQRVMASAMQRVPLLPNTEIKIGSTPNGEDNSFYETYQLAKEGKKVGASVFKSHFYPWYTHPEYFLEASNPFVADLPGLSSPLLTGLDSDELSLLKRFESLNIPEQHSHDMLRWRRYKTIEMNSLNRQGKTRMLFPQEYPEDDVTCFMSAGDMVYDSQVVNDKARDCFPAPIHKLFADIWEEPEPGITYLLAIDPGEGITSESVGTVWRFSDNEFRHVATLAGLYKGDEMAEKCIPLAIYYNNAVIANEDALEFTGYIKSYPNLYYREDIVSGKVSRFIGWATTPRTKPYMITELNRHMDKLNTHDIRLVSQFRNIRWIQGRRGDRAVAVGADDYHDSAAIAVCCRSSIPVHRGLVGTTSAGGWDDNWGR